MFNYQLTTGSTILRSDGAQIPADPANTDFIVYQAWLAAGNVPAPMTVDLTAAWTAHQGAARAALCESDLTLLRCIENGVAVPAGWTAYRKALRAIVSAASGDASQPLPTRPAYPAGT